jgi:ankyrin repeat protein
LPLLFSILDNNADVNVSNMMGETSLHLVSRRGYANIVKELLGKNVDLSMQNNNGKTPLELARENGHINITRLLTSYSKSRENKA